MQTISTIAREISHNWKNVNYAAKPYLQAMHSLDSASDSFGYDSAKSVVSYFLANATGYRTRAYSSPSKGIEPLPQALAWRFPPRDQQRSRYRQAHMEKPSTTR